MHKDFQYAGFLCHSTRANGALVAALRDELHRRSRLFFGLRRIHLFQDRSDLSATPRLWSELEERLKASKRLLVIGTPEAEASPGMDNEITWWLKHRDMESLHVVMLGGEVTWDSADTCFRTGSALPTTLQAKYEEEPFYYDLRGYRAAGSGSDAYTDDTVWSLLAELMGKTADEVRRSDRWRRWLERIAAVAAVTAVGVAATVALLQAQERAVLEQSAKADLFAARAVAKREDVPSAAASHALAALSTARTSNAIAEAHRTALRWPFLAGLWQLQTAPDSIVVLDPGTPNRTATVFVCAGTAASVLNLGISGVVTKRHTLSLGHLPAEEWPRGWQPRCWAQKRYGADDYFVTVRFAPTNDDFLGQAIPGPSVFRVSTVGVTKLRGGTYNDTAEDVCAAPNIVGFAFVLDGDAWRCEKGEALRISSGADHAGVRSLDVSEDETLLHVSDDGRFVAAIEVISPEVDPACARPRAVGQPVPDCPPRQDPPRVLALFDARDRSVNSIPTALQRGDRIVSVTSRSVTYRGYDRFGKVSLVGARPGNTYDSKPPNWDIDAFDENPIAREEWEIRSSPYTGSERDQSFIMGRQGLGRFEFERFGGFRRNARQVLIVKSGHALVAAADGQLEYYVLAPQAFVAAVRPSAGIKRVDQCDPIAGLDREAEWVLALGPSGMLVLVDPDSADVIHSKRARTNIYQQDQSDAINDVVGHDLPAPILEHLQDRWHFARVLRTGLHNIATGRHGAILAGIDRGTLEFVVSVNGAEIAREVVLDNDYQRYNTTIRVSRSGRFVVISVDGQTFLYSIDADAREVTLVRTIEGNLAAVSDDDQFLAVVNGLSTTVFVLSDGEGEPLELFTTPAHENGNMELAFDRGNTLLFVAGHDRRLAIYDIARATRLDPAMKIHNDTVEGLCPLSPGNVLTVDQSEITIHWQVSETRIVERLNVLASMGGNAGTGQ